MLQITQRIFRTTAATALATTVTTAAVAAPSGAHPRLWLDSETKQGLKTQASLANSPEARGAARCSAARNDPSDY